MEGFTSFDGVVALVIMFCPFGWPMARPCTREFWPLGRLDSPPRYSRFLLRRRSTGCVRNSGCGEFPCRQFVNYRFRAFAIVLAIALIVVSLFTPLFLVAVRDRFWGS